MSEINLEKIDSIRERADVSYTTAKEALEACDGDILEALIYIEKNARSKKEEIYTSTEGLLNWIKEKIKTGNVNRIRIKKDDKVILDVPVTAGVAVGVVSLFYTPLIAIIGVGTVAAVVTQLTIEVTKTDGSVEIVDKIIKSSFDTAKEKVTEFISKGASEIKEKINTIKGKKETKENTEKQKNVYQYTVKFDDDYVGADAKAGADPDAKADKDNSQKDDADKDKN